jgi:hypothetical protein
MGWSWAGALRPATQAYFWAEGAVEVRGESRNPALHAVEATPCACISRWKGEFPGRASWRDHAHEVGNKRHRRIHVGTTLPYEMKRNRVQRRPARDVRPAATVLAMTPVGNAASKSVSHNNASACKKVGATVATRRWCPIRASATSTGPSGLRCCKRPGGERPTSNRGPTSQPLPPDGRVASRRNRGICRVVQSAVMRRRQTRRS